MSTKGSHARSLNRDNKKLHDGWNAIDFSKKDSDKKKIVETKLKGRTRITYGG